ncbi:MAG TPA: hypothetical protein VJ547_00575 [Candidatus Thermoplasmatota archaeon]|nr:hypothetical protein [Candidatus Thermoplasmatota archaeon]
MATEPWFLLFPAVGAITFGVLGSRLVKKRASLSGLGADWGAAFGFGALAMAGVLAAGAKDWSGPSQFTASFTGAAAGLALAAALSGIYNRQTRGGVGSVNFRWAAYAAALGLEGLAWGALLASPDVGGVGSTAGWAAVPPAGGAAAVVVMGALVARQVLPRAGPSNTLQLILGAALAVSGFTWGAVGDPLLGPSLAMAGAGFLQAGALTVSSLAPSAVPRAVRPKVEKPPRERPPKAAGVKVRVPKGGAQRVTSFRDVEPPEGGRP